MQKRFQDRVSGISLDMEGTVKDDNFFGGSCFLTYSLLWYCKLLSDGHENLGEVIAKVTPCSNTCNPVNLWPEEGCVLPSLHIIRLKDLES